MAKKRANGEGTIRKRKNGTWEARVTLGFDEDTGKQKYKCVYGRSQREVKEKLEELFDNKDQIVTDGTTVEDWLNVWLSDFVADVKDGTLAQYESICRNHIKPAIGDIKLSELKVPAIQKFYNSLSKKGLSPKYIKNIHGCLHRALDVAVKTEQIAKNPTSSCIIPKVIQKQIVPIDVPEQKRLLRILDSEYYGTLILVDIFTGMRVGEIIGLTWDCVDFEHGVIRIEKQIVQTRRKNAKYKFGTLKNDKMRIISPAKYVMDELKNHKARQDMLKQEAGSLWNEGDFPNLVFTHADGSHLSQPTVWKEFQKILDHAGLSHYRVHDLRHTFAVNSIIAGDDIKTLQENMGHYSSAFTLDRYGHVTEMMRKKSADRMQNFIEEMTEQKAGNGTVMVR